MAQVLEYNSNILIDSSLSKGVFLSFEKIGKVLPIYESGERSSLDNYQPIAVLSFLSKLLENTASKQIVEYQQQSSLICVSGEHCLQAQNPTHQISAGTSHPNLYMAIYYSLFFLQALFSDLHLQAQNT